MMVVPIRNQFKSRFDDQSNDPVDIGFEDYQVGKLARQNPYRVGSFSASLWLRGWKQAYSEDTL